MPECRIALNAMGPTMVGLDRSLRGKILHVKADRAQSAVPQRKDETMHVLRVSHPGTQAKELVSPVKAVDSARPPKLIHQIEAVGQRRPEASTPELDDLVRLQDRYGRD